MSPGVPSRVACWLLVVGVAGCGEDADPAGTSAPAASAPAAVPAEILGNDPKQDCGCDQEVEALETRLSRLELTVGDLQTNGVYEADSVRYQPARSRLSARNVQDAVDEIAARVGQMQGTGQDMGPASPVIFDPNFDHGGPLPPGQKPPGSENRPVQGAGGPGQPGGGGQPQGGGPAGPPQGGGPVGPASGGGGRR